MGHVHTHVIVCARVFSEVGDVVNAVLYLLSNEADMVNGTTLMVDGGFTAC